MGARRGRAPAPASVEPVRGDVGRSDASPLGEERLHDAPPDPSGGAGHDHAPRPSNRITAPPGSAAAGPPRRGRRSTGTCRRRSRRPPGRASPPPMRCSSERRARRRGDRPRPAGRTVRPAMRTMPSGRYSVTQRLPSASSATPSASVSGRRAIVSGSPPNRPRGSAPGPRARPSPRRRRAPTPSGVTRHPFGYAGTAVVHRSASPPPGTTRTISGRPSSPEHVTYSTPSGPNAATFGQSISRRPRRSRTRTTSPVAGVLEACDLALAAVARVHAPRAVDGQPEHRPAGRPDLPHRAVEDRSRRTRPTRHRRTRGRRTGSSTHPPDG